MGCGGSKSTGTTSQTGSSSPPSGGSGPMIYKTDASPPCRALMMVAEDAKIAVQYTDVDLQKGEHKKPAYMKINPQSTVPAIKDGDFVLGESRAIITYLMDKYAPDNALYPKDPQQRAKIDRWLFFDFGTLAAAVLPFVGPQVFGGAAASDEKKEKVQKVLETMETMMTSTFLTGSAITVADYCVVCTLSILEWVDFKPEKCPKVSAWYTKMKELPAFENNSAGWKAVKDRKKN